MASPGCRPKDGPAHQAKKVQYAEPQSHIFLAALPVQLRTQVYLVISLYINLRNPLH